MAAPIAILKSAHAAILPHREQAKAPEPASPQGLRELHTAKARLMTLWGREDSELYLAPGARATGDPEIRDTIPVFATDMTAISDMAISSFCQVRTEGHRPGIRPGR